MDTHTDARVWGPEGSVLRGPDTQSSVPCDAWGWCQGCEAQALPPWDGKCQRPRLDFEEGVCPGHGSYFPSRMGTG